MIRLPFAYQKTALAAVIDKAIYIMKRITEKNAYFVRKAVTAEPYFQYIQIIIEIPVLRISVL